MKIEMTQKIHHRVIYYLRRYPVLSETFIQREILALKRCNVDVITIADEADELGLFSGEVRSLALGTRYGPRFGSIGYMVFICREFLRDPKVFLRLTSRIRKDNYSRFKSFREDARILGRIVYLGATARQLGITHIHAPWAAINSYIGLLAAGLCGAEFTLQVRAFELYSPQDRYMLVEKLSAASIVITNTNYNLQNIRNIDGLSRKHPVCRIYNGIDVNDISTSPRPRLSLGGTCRILCVGRLVPQKGIEHLLDAVRHLLDRDRDVRCDIIGGPFMSRYAGYYEGLLEQLDQLDLRETVRFLGPKPNPDVMSYYQDADIFVLPCVVEPGGNRDVIPNVLLEAMAFELPVITSRIVGIPEMIDDGVHGILLPPKNSLAIADAVDRLLHHPEYASFLGRNARLRVEERFDIHRNIQGMADLFRRTGIHRLEGAESVSDRLPRPIDAQAF